MTPSRGTFDGRILIIDDDEAFRRVVTAQLQHAACSSIAVETWEEGLDIFRRDADIEVVLLDHPTVNSGVKSLVDAFRAVRPAVTIVGNSGSDRRADFAAAGVTQYLHKPWRMTELFTLLPSRLLTCGECGSHLPLRRPKPDETGQSWVCATCGARYYAVLDADASPDLRPYAVPASGYDV